MPLRVSSVFVSKFDQAVYWMDRAKRAGVPRKMQIEGLLEELKLDLMDILVPPAPSEKKVEKELDKVSNV